MLVSMHIIDISESIMHLSRVLTSFVDTSQHDNLLLTNSVSRHKKITKLRTKAASTVLKHPENFISSTVLTAIKSFKFHFHYWIVFVAALSLILIPFGYNIDLKEL